MKGEEGKKFSSHPVLWAVIIALFVYILVITAVNGWLTVKVQNHEERIQHNDEKTRRNEERIQRHEERIQRHEERIQRHEERIQRHEERIQRHEERIQRHEEIIQQLEQKLNQQNSAADDTKNTDNRLIQTVKNTEVKREVLKSGSADILNLLKQGIRGPPGIPGKDGLPGLPGRDGRDSSNLALIDRHINTAVNQAVESEIVKLNSIVRSVPQVSGAVYIRWGRTSCPSKSTLVMKGVAAGTYYSAQGGSAQYTCISDDPEYHPLARKASSYSRLSGVEYENVVEAMFGKALHDHNAPCSYCQTDGRAQQIMIPGRMRCSAGWTLEYQGFLMSASNTHSDHHRTEYVCVDKDAETMPGLAHSTYGALWYHVVADCVPDYGYLGYCPPYKPDLPLSCVVCSK